MPRTSKQEHTELSIEADSPVPLYQRVKQLISQKIYEGTWAVNKKFLRKVNWLINSVVAV